MSHASRRKAFTLIELLVVIAIIAILAAILFPVFAKARERAKTTTCINNMKQIGIACLTYLQDYDDTYPKNRNYAGLPGWTWKRAIQPLLKSYDVWKDPSVTSYWFRSPYNGAPGDESNIAPYVIPSDAGKNQWMPLSYAYSGGFFHEGSSGGDRPRKSSEVKDPAGTLWVLNSRMAFPDLGPWTLSWRITKDGQNYEGSPNGPGIGPFVQHGGRIPFIFADGHVSVMKLVDTYNVKDMWLSKAWSQAQTAQSGLSMAKEYK